MPVAPYAWGCRSSTMPFDLAAVRFPGPSPSCACYARVGCSRMVACPAGIVPIAPRARGCRHVAAVGCRSDVSGKVSRARGCCAGVVICSWILPGFPACAGVSLPRCVSCHPPWRFPRVRGGVAVISCMTPKPTAVFPRSISCERCVSRFSRVRGGVAHSRPSLVNKVAPRSRGCRRFRCSDRWRTRGCPASRGCRFVHLILVGVVIGFPACAGMSPSPAGTRRQCRRRGFPASAGMSRAGCW